MKAVVCFFMFLGALEMHGNTVDWGQFALVTVEGCPTVGYAGTHLYTDTSLSLRLMGAGNAWTVTESGYTSLISFSDWTLAYANEIIASKMFEDAGRVYLWRGERTGESFVVNASSDVFYLAFRTLLWKDAEFTLKDRVTYGWVCMSVQDGRLSLLDSAISLDGSAIHVGGDVIPEPTSAVLVVIGFSALSLLRKRS